MPSDSNPLLTWWHVCRSNTPPYDTDTLMSLDPLHINNDKTFKATLTPPGLRVPQTQIWLGSIECTTTWTGGMLLAFSFAWNDAFEPQDSWSPTTPLYCSHDRCHLFQLSVVLMLSLTRERIFFLQGWRMSASWSLISLSTQRFPLHLQFKCCMCLPLPWPEYLWACFLLWHWVVSCCAGVSAWFVQGCFVCTTEWVWPTG